MDLWTSFVCNMRVSKMLFLWLPIILLVKAPTLIITLPTFGRAEPSHDAVGRKAYSVGMRILVSHLGCPGFFTVPSDFICLFVCISLFAKRTLDLVFKLPSSFCFIWKHSLLHLSNQLVKRLYYLTSFSLAPNIIFFYSIIFSLSLFGLISVLFSRTWQPSDQPHHTMLCFTKMLTHFCISVSHLRCSLIACSV